MYEYRYVYEFTKHARRWIWLDIRVYGYRLFGVELYTYTYWKDTYHIYALDVRKRLVHEQLNKIYAGKRHKLFIFFGIPYLAYNNL